MSREDAELARQREQQRHDRRARRVVDARSEDPATAPLRDVLHDSLMEVMADALFDAIHSPGFRQMLAERGLALAPASDEQPTAPQEWAERALDLFGAYGALADPIEVVDELYRDAHRNGWESRAAVVPDPDPALEEARATEDAAWGDVWLHGKWRWITTKMSTEERELAAAAVERWGARIDDGEPEDRTSVRWWKGL
jgi:hypothetical protein